MKNKGFTLIELLAVIVILGVIALIAIPVIFKIIEDVKVESFKTSMTNMINSIEEDCQTSTLKGELPSKKYIIENGISNEKINVVGKLPNTGVISINNECKTYAYLSNNDYFISKDINDDKFSDILKDSFDNIMTLYANGTPVYFNPTTGKTCVESEVQTGVGTMNGCMRWYIFNDEKGNKDVDMILEHNLYKILAFEQAPVKLQQLGWVSGLNQRMMTLDEFKKIANNDISVSNLSTKGEDGYSIYAWLYNYTTDNTSNPCTEQNCKYYGENSGKYWLDTKTENYETSTRIYVVGSAVITNRVKGDGGVGIRPVITISKSLFSNN